MVGKAPPIISTLGDYRVVDSLGAGGMGVVYRAVHTKLGRVAAIKLLNRTALDDDAMNHRFLNEARIQSNLHHPNIATLYDFLELNGQACIIMEYVDGQTLAEIVRPHGPLPLPETVRIFQAVVEAVGHIHKFGIVHRDIKSSNIKVSKAGQVKLLDFGIAKSQTSPQLTETGHLIGTLEYLPPEQIMTGKADARSDIWALGVLLYEMCTGRMPFRGVTIGELCANISKGEYQAPSRLNPSIPADMSAIISRCLKKNPADRYQSAGALLQDFARLVSDGPTQRQTDDKVLAERVNSTERQIGQASYSWLKKSRLLVLSIVAVFAVLFALAVFGISWRFTNSTAETSLSTQTKTIRIDTLSGKAEVYREGEKIGETPLDLKVAFGDNVELTLKLVGFEDYQLKFGVTPQTNREFITEMQKKTNNEP